MKYIPLANLKNTTGIVNFCKEAKELVVANRNGLPKIVLMSREVYENGLGRLTDRVLLNVHRDMELVAEPVLIRTFNNPAEIVRICEKEMGKIVSVLRIGLSFIFVPLVQQFDNLLIFLRFHHRITFQLAQCICILFVRFLHKFYMTLLQFL